MNVYSFWMDQSGRKNRVEVENILPSVTIPNQSLTVRQLIERHMQGGDLVNPMGMRYDIPYHMKDEDAEQFLRYYDNPDDLTSYDELSAFATSYYQDKKLQEEEAERLKLAQKQVVPSSPESVTPTEGS